MSAIPPSGPREVARRAAGVLQSSRRARRPGVAVARGLLRRVRFFFLLTREDYSIQDTTKRVRVNRQIRISPVRVIGADGSQLGIMEVDAALRMAEEAGLDLVEVAATARPPVVRIMDYGKYKFEMAKQARHGEEEAARDRAQGSEVPPGHRRSRLRDEDAARAPVPAKRRTR